MVVYSTAQVTIELAVKGKRHIEKEKKMGEKLQNTEKTLWKESKIMYIIILTAPVYTYNITYIVI